MWTWLASSRSVDVAGQLAQDRVELLLGVLRREVLGGGAGAVAGAPDGRAAWGAAAGVAHMRGAKALGPAHAVCIAPQGAVDTLSVAAFLRDLEMRPSGREFLLMLLMTP